MHCAHPWLDAPQQGMALLRSDRRGDGMGLGACADLYQENERRGQLLLLGASTI
jgi:hypothetical protein